ncbi:HIT domain-containing protein [Neptunomonas qingdaonensis]|uniref:Diadenosine tetraphosphate (Ap4A) hydrolase n=1 Tax=Neptunomonas qingdaonensis TaxID=1045558 RepID=A0A1I2RT80_9GAMM|nr:HIT domain-containing protein [Neptunomonas qingdaonensis]SFG42739.1 Diadenosine tetraphosphate (Ap4A) hydrolase [Neptunomonas qingdaonensis]
MDELELEFELDSRLANDCIVLGDFPLSRLLLMNDANYPWFILVPRRAGATEIYHLSPQDQHQLIDESSELAEIMADSFSARKMNIANLGNMVPQLHLHHVARHEGDPAWPGPVWGKQPAVRYSEEQIAQIRKRVESMLVGEVSFVAGKK